MLVSVSIVTVGDTESQLDPVTDVVQRFADAGIPYQINGMSTVVEGEWDDVMDVLSKAATDLRLRHERVIWNIVIDDHRSAENRLARAAGEVQERLLAQVDCR